MTKSARELFEEAMRLDPKERATLMRLLVDSLDAESEEGAEEVWRAEIERRIAELDSGQIQAVSWEELRARLYQR
ncbi:MAG TPA: addiction module protein [Terrimesophilobacter sp.]|jgi:putative addiction module component (TIGR02574 family)|uniref:addiction module protein n=1 Tax=Terrimesophilobacter sp. TaxID=2906435 RepID=UPI002F93FED8